MCSAAVHPMIKAKQNELTLSLKKVQLETFTAAKIRQQPASLPSVETKIATKELSIVYFFICRGATALDIKASVELC